MDTKLSKTAYSTKAKVSGGGVFLKNHFNTCVVLKAQTERLAAEHPVSHIHYSTRLSRLVLPRAPLVLVCLRSVRNTT